MIPAHDHVLQHILSSITHVLPRIKHLFIYELNKTVRALILQNSTISYMSLPTHVFSCQPAINNIAPCAPSTVTRHDHSYATSSIRVKLDSYTAYIKMYIKITIVNQRPQCRLGVERRVEAWPWQCSTEITWADEWKNYHKYLKKRF